jgi:hypothetical protein
VNFVAIDPGLDGAVARLQVVGSDPVLASAKTWDAPVAQDGRHRVLLGTEMKRILVEAAGRLGCVVVIEKVTAFPNGSRASAFTFGDGYGMWKGICVGLGLRYELVKPKKWQREMLAGMQGGKDASCIKAMELFPDVDLKKGPRTQKLHDGRADALLMAEYARRVFRNE